MFLSHVLRRPFRPGLLALAAASLLFAAGSASAQQFDYQFYHRGVLATHQGVAVYPPVLNPRSRGSDLPLYWYVQSNYQYGWWPTPVAYEVVYVPVAPPPLVVTVSVPPEPKPLYVDIRGPEGTVRSFPVAGGASTIHTTNIVVRPGESATIRLAVGLSH